MSVQPWPAAPSGFLSAGAPPADVAPSLARLKRVRHGFFGAKGGVSRGAFAGLNAGRGTRDDPANVAENRKRIAEAIGARAENLIGPYQVHSARAVFSDQVWTERPEADAVVTTTPGLALSVLGADCTPVLFVDEHAGVIAAAHAGWRGALDGVLEATVACMVEHGADRARILAAIGPCVHQASYEVGPEFEARFLEKDPGFSRFFRQTGPRPHFDLPGFCADRLTAAGIGAIDLSARDTYADADWFSHRRAAHRSEADCGRNCAAIVLNP